MGSDGWGWVKEQMRMGRKEGEYYGGRAWHVMDRAWREA